MSNSEILKVVGIEVPDGGLAMGTKVKLSNGQYLTGIQSITLHADTDSKLWSLSLKMTPDFVDQKTIEAVLANVELVQHQSVPQRMHILENRIADLQNEYSYLKEHGNEAAKAKP